MWNVTTVPRVTLVTGAACVRDPVSPQGLGWGPTHTQSIPRALGLCPGEHPEPAGTLQCPLPPPATPWQPLHPLAAPGSPWHTAGPCCAPESPDTQSCSGEGLQVSPELGLFPQSVCTPTSSPRLKGLGWIQKRDKSSRKTNLPFLSSFPFLPTLTKHAQVMFPLWCFTVLEQGSSRALPCLLLGCGAHQLCLQPLALQGTQGSC